MTKFSDQFSRRKFIVTAGASAVSSVLLKGCLGNPPEPGASAGADATAGAGTAPAATSVVAVANEKRVEGIEKH
jgi:hypothetical protein